MHEKFKGKFENKNGIFQISSPCLESTFYAPNISNVRKRDSRNFSVVTLMGGLAHKTEINRAKTPIRARGPPANKNSPPRILPEYLCTSLFPLSTIRFLTSLRVKRLGFVLAAFVTHKTPKEYITRSRCLGIAFFGGSFFFFLRD